MKPTVGSKRFLKNDKLLARLIKKKKRQDSSKTTNERGNIIIDLKK